MKQSPVSVVVSFMLVALGTACSSAGQDLVQGGGSSQGQGATASGGGTTGIDLGSVGQGSNGGTTLVDPNTACVADASEGEQAPIDLYLMVDKSGSMACLTTQTTEQCMQNQMPSAGTSRWQAVTSALEGFVTAPANAGIGVGLGFFPHAAAGTTPPDQECMASCQDCACMQACGCQTCNCTPLFGGQNLCLCADDTDASCNAADYVPPAVEIAPLPSASSGITGAIDKESPNGSTPTVPSLQGALKHAQDWLLAHPDRRVAVVYSTDGEPQNCEPDNTVENAALAAEAAFKGNPPIPTYVIGVGPSLNSLNRIAEAGGTTQAYLVDSGDVAQQFSEALNSIRNRSLSCNYVIPKTGADLDLGLVNVQVTVGASGTPTIISQAPSEGECGTQDAWFYDNPAQPSAITLCPNICNQLLGTPGSKLEVLIGCATIPVVK